MDFEKDVKLLCYADDLQLISQGYNKLQKAQRALQQIEEKCIELGLKINPLKTKAMAIKQRRMPEGRLAIQGTDIDWVTTHPCLGITFDSSLTFQPHIEALKERMAARINAMRRMTGLSAGADYAVLRAYYVHAIRSLIDYSSLALARLSPTQLHILQVQQNKALRLIVGVPIWTKVSNLQMETNIAPIEARVTKKVAATAAKILTRPGYEMARRRLRTAVAQGALFDTTRWTRKVSSTLASSGISYAAALGDDQPSRNYMEPPPWERDRTIYNCKLPDVPRGNVAGRRIQGELQIARLMSEDTAVYYTDGSVDSYTGRSGAAFVHNGEEFPSRLSDGCCSLQAKLAAIQKATSHALHSTNKTIIVHTDSKSAIETLQRRHQPDNVQLTTSVLANIWELQRRGKTVILNWIPSHVGIEGNEAADQAAKDAAVLAEVTFQVRPSLAKLKIAAKRRAKDFKDAFNRSQAEQGSWSCRWYQGVTGAELLQVARDTPRSVRVNLHRLRLGYLCNWRLPSRPVVRPCTHCQEEQDNPLYHWILECPSTKDLRLVTNTKTTDSNSEEARDVAIETLRKLFAEHQGILTTVISQHPPPR